MRGNDFDFIVGHDRFLDIGDSLSGRTRYDTAGSLTGFTGTTYAPRFGRKRIRPVTT